MQLIAEHVHFWRVIRAVVREAELMSMPKLVMSSHMLCISIDSTGTGKKAAHSQNKIKWNRHCKHQYFL